MSTYIEHRNPKRSEITVGFNPRSNANKQIGNKVAGGTECGGGNRTFRLSHKASPCPFKARGNRGEKESTNEGRWERGRGREEEKKVERILHCVKSIPPILLGRAHNYANVKVPRWTSPSPIARVGYHPGVLEYVGPALRQTASNASVLSVARAMHHRPRGKNMNRDISRVYMYCVHVDGHVNRALIENFSIAT